MHPSNLAQVLPMDRVQPKVVCQVPPELVCKNIDHCPLRQLNLGLEELHKCLMLHPSRCFSGLVSPGGQGPGLCVRPTRHWMMFSVQGHARCQHAAHPAYNRPATQSVKLLTAANWRGNGAGGTGKL